VVAACATPCEYGEAKFDGDHAVIAPLAASALSKARRRIIPFLFLLYVVAYLDRVNVGFGALDMNRDLGFSAAVYGFGSGVFFLSYTLLEVPSNLLLARIGARVWIARIMVTWGLVASAMAFVNSAGMFYALRFVLGAAEAGFFPGIIFYLTRWFPARERGRTISLFMTATAMAGVIGAPLSSALLRLEGVWGLHGWQWLFIIEGLPAVLLAPIVLRYLTERPEDAEWLSPDQRSWLAREMAHEHAQTAGAHVKFGDAVRSVRLWALALVYFGLVMAFYGVSFWLPQIVQAAGTLSSATVVLLTAIPYVVATAGMVIVGVHSDRTGERRWHVALPALIGAAGLVLTVLVPPTVGTSLTTLSIAAFGVWSALGPFWTMPAAFLRGTAAAGGIAVVNSVGNLGGFVGPSFVGYVRALSGGFGGGLLALAAGLVIAAIIVISIEESKAESSS
jgi:ACS family tartrate transporter-like MFS transporter